MKLSTVFCARSITVSKFYHLGSSHYLGSVLPTYTYMYVCDMCRLGNKLKPVVSCDVYYHSCLCTDRVC